MNNPDVRARSGTLPETGSAPLGPHKAFRLLTDVASFLAQGVGSEDVLAGVVGVLCRGLGNDDCRVWVRTPDGAAFRPMLAEGTPHPPAGRSDAVRRWVGGAETHEREGKLWRIRAPLVHEGERLGLLEAAVPEGPEAPMLRQAVGIVANLLAPLLAFIELSEDLASEVALRTLEIESQRRFTAKIIDSLPVGLYVIDRDYLIQAWNRKRETAGVVRDEALGRTVFEVLPRQPRDLLQQEFDRVFRTGRMEQVEVESNASGETRYYRITKIPMRINDDDVTHVITIGEDLTDWKAVQRQVSENEKLAAVGQLAAGVMHEVNNPLATIGACIEALTFRTSDISEGLRSSFDEYLRIVDSELERCKSIIDGLLDFSRPKARVTHPEQVNQIVEDALFLVKHHDRFKKIELVRELAEGLPEIQVNKEQCIQVFLALMLNAIDAMEGKKGVLTVSTRFDVQRGEVVVGFTDTGMGISRENLSKIFEPFFTTKEPGRGTGLGLSICYGIVAHHGGRINVESQVGRGSAFRVCLPLVPVQDQG